MSKEYEWPLGAGKARIRNLPGASGREWNPVGLQHDSFWTFHLQNHKVVNLCPFKALSLW